ncbi:hypothetical protein G6R29_04670 [Fructobacillus sp. M2-14]|uniref:Uncharacterized protein n=1 Tax=Fructobacillus broussonetiae TaxID=2713173 RepID=A0ABS5R0E2_9LACO|nr:hypothetical protein [Fructobacillus broussonetiae]MBS9338918.1 hypothetical protein [Fructobacillus broussonetiae]
MSLQRDTVGMKLPHYSEEELDALFTPEMIAELQERIYGDYYLPPEPHQLRMWGYSEEEIQSEMEKQC